MRETPYVQEIELCEQLIQYCTRLTPQKEEANETPGISKEEAVKKALQSDEWKKVKFDAVKGRREEEDYFFVGKKKDKKKPVEKEKEPENFVQALNHGFETLNYFDAIKISPPLFSDKLEETIKVLREKKAYFQKLQDDAGRTEEEKKNAPEESKGEESEKKKDEEKPKDDKSPRKKKKDAKPELLDTQNDKEFPKFENA